MEHQCNIPAGNPQPFAADGEPCILDATDSLLVLYKPSGWHSVSQSRDAASGSTERSLVRWLEDHAAELPPSELAQVAGEPRHRSAEERFMRELGMLSRLDEPTSGVILCALDQKTFFECLKAQDEGRLIKQYRMYCSWKGAPLPGSLPGLREDGQLKMQRLLETQIPFAVQSRFRGFGPRGARVACIAEEHERSVRKQLAPGLYRTEFFAARIAQRAFDVLEALVSISKGFRHQIRAHAAWLGYPIVGDKLYGGIDAPRLMLEAYSIELADEGHQTLYRFSMEATTD
ncbi:MAG: pseudouridine synthase, partial [Rectinemataceae bacterium]